MAGAHAEAVVPPDGGTLYLTLPDGPAAEAPAPGLVDRSAPGYAHQKVTLCLRDELAAQLEGRGVVAVGVSWLMPAVEGPQVRVPDLMVLLEEPVADVVTSAPLVVVEVVAPGRRADDLVLRSPEYLAAGVEQYWIVDPRDRVIDMFGRGAAGWERLAHLDDTVPEGSVDVPEVGPLSVALAAVLGKLAA